VPDLLDQLRDQRTAVRAAGDEILTRAATEQRDLTPDELAAHGTSTVQARELDDRIEALLPTRWPNSAPPKSAPQPATCPANRS
jgi:hypothetical protein